MLFGNNILDFISSRRISYKKYDELEEFSIKGHFLGKVVRAYDGDTIWVCIIYKNKCVRLNCRVLGIDANEMPKSYAEAMSDYYKQAYESRDRLIDLVTNIDIKSIKENHLKTHKQFTDTSGVSLPSFSDHDMQVFMDKNTQLIHMTFENGVDKYGRYLVHLHSKDGKNVGSILLSENLAKKY